MSSALRRGERIKALLLQPSRDGAHPAAQQIGGERQQQETGNHLYRAFRSRKDKNTYVVMEIYADDDALKAHGKSEHFRAASPKLGAVLAGAPDIHFMDAV